MWRASHALGYSVLTVPEGEETRMDLDDVKKTAEGLTDKARDFVQSTVKDEAATDRALDAVANAAKKVTGGSFDEKIETARAEADKRIGSE
jgi:hypothetical protein